MRQKTARDNKISVAITFSPHNLSPGVKKAGVWRMGI
jgi:hypothetical protein